MLLRIHGKYLSAESHEALHWTNVTRKKLLPDIDCIGKNRYFPLQYHLFIVNLCFSSSLVVLFYEIICFLLHWIFQPSFTVNCCFHIQQSFLTIQELRIEILFRSVGAGVHSTLGVFKSRHSSLSEPEAWSIQQPLCFYSALLHPGQSY